MKLLTILYEDYGQSIVWHINEATRDYEGSKATINDETLYKLLLEHKENQTIYHNIAEESNNMKAIYQDGIDLNRIFLDDGEDLYEIDPDEKF